MWERPYFEATNGRALIHLVIFTRDKPALEVDLDAEDGFPEGYELPTSISVRTAALVEHRERFASFLEGPFRELAAMEVGESTAAAIDEARHAVSIQGFVPDPPDLRHMQAVRAFERFLARTAGAIAIANDLSLAWHDAAWFGSTDPAAGIAIDEWIEVVHSEERCLHTVGMVQFARPDIAVLDTPEHALADVADLLRSVAEAGALGKVFQSRTALDVEGDLLELSRLDDVRCEALALARGTLVLEGISY